MPDRNPPTAPDSLPAYIADGVPKQDDQTLVELRDWIDSLLAHRRQEVTEDDLPDAAEPVEDDAGGKGTIVEEMVTCGDQSCACMNGGDKHGPYRYRYYYADGALQSEYIGKA